VAQAVNSFVEKFSEDNLQQASKELEDLLLVAQFTPIEKNKFISRIRKYLSSKNVSLDCLK